MNYVFLMDPLHSIIAKKDTSLALMVGAHRKGHKVYFLPDGGIVLKDGKLQFHVLEVTPQYDDHHPFSNHNAKIFLNLLQYHLVP